MKKLYYYIIAFIITSLILINSCFKSSPKTDTNPSDNQSNSHVEKGGLVKSKSAVDNLENIGILGNPADVYSYFPFMYYPDSGLLGKNSCFDLTKTVMYVNTAAVSENIVLNSFNKQFSNEIDLNMAVKGAFDLFNMLNEASLEFLEPFKIENQIDLNYTEQTNASTINLLITLAETAAIKLQPSEINSNFTDILLNDPKAAYLENDINKTKFKQLCGTGFVNEITAGYIGKYKLKIKFNSAQTANKYKSTLNFSYGDIASFSSVLSQLIKEFNDSYTFTLSYDGKGGFGAPDIPAECNNGNNLISCLSGISRSFNEFQVKVATQMENVRNQLNQKSNYAEALKTLGLWGVHSFSIARYDNLIPITPSNDMLKLRIDIMKDIVNATGVYKLRAILGLPNNIRNYLHSINKDSLIEILELIKKEFNNPNSEVITGLHYITDNKLVTVELINRCFLSEDIEKCKEFAYGDKSSHNFAYYLDVIKTFLKAFPKNDLEFLSDLAISGYIDNIPTTCLQPYEWKNLLSKEQIKQFNLSWNGEMINKYHLVTLCETTPIGDKLNNNKFYSRTIIDDNKDKYYSLNSLHIDSENHGKDSVNFYGNDFELTNNSMAIALSRINKRLLSSSIEGHSWIGRGSSWKYMVFNIDSPIADGIHFNIYFHHRNVQYVCPAVIFSDGSGAIPNPINNNHCPNNHSFSLKINWDHRDTINVDI